MFKKIEHTKFPPKEKPLLVWDGACGFCKYWVTRWKKLTKDKVAFKPYQEVAHLFPDIPLKEFKKASRFISTKGTVHSGPDSAYKSYQIANAASPWHSWYNHYSWFQKLSDHGYNYIAKNRSFFFKLTKFLLGSNPLSFKHFWLLYLFIVFSILILILKLL